MVEVVAQPRERARPFFTFRCDFMDDKSISDDEIRNVNLIGSESLPCYGLSEEYVAVFWLVVPCASIFSDFWLTLRFFGCPF